MDAISKVRSQRKPNNEHVVLEVVLEKLKAACSAFTSEWEDELIDELAKRENNEAFVDHFCSEITEICKDVDMESFVAEESEIVRASVPPEIFENGEYERMVADL